MKFTLAWLKEHLDTEATLDEIAGTLTMIGLEVEEVSDPGKALAAFTVAHVVAAEQHPNADRLKVCMVDTGAETVQVVCGAPNARAGMKGVFAPAGTTVPGTGMELARASIRGVESNGMLCSQREMGLSDEHEGIIELPDDAPLGAPFAQILGLDDPVIEIAVTPNRADCLGVYGIARDLAAAGIGNLKDAPVKAVEGGFGCPVGISLDFGDTVPLCPGFALRLVRGVTNGPSPEWLQRRLRAIGLRPINALVDITNYITFDRARPLHVFDAAKVTGDLTVRRAKAGETLLALDGRTYALDPAMCVIADDAGVESLAGIMGGEASGCTEATTDVLIESALWVPSNVAETGRRLGIHSDARFRFERGVDPQFMAPGLELATRMVLDLCGGEASHVAIAGGAADEERIIDFDIAQVERLAGLKTGEAEIKVVLRRLGLWAAGRAEDGPLKVALPSWRADIEGQADLVEEVVRIIGVDKVPSTPLPRRYHVARPILTLAQRRRREVRRALAARGMVEAVTWSFVSKMQAQAFGGGMRALELANPISSEMSDMRPSLLPGLIAAAQRNADRGYGDLALFEIGQAYRGDRPEDQFDAAAGIRRAGAHMTGSGRHWSDGLKGLGGAGPVTLFDAKADALDALAAANAPVASLQVTATAPEWYHPGRSGSFQLGPKTVLASFGELHPALLERFDVDGPVVAFELFLDAVPAPRARPTRAKPPLQLAELQPVRRDFAFVVDSQVPAQDLLRAARAADKALITDVVLFDLFEDASLGPAKKSLGIEVTLQPRERTLTDAEIDAVAARIVAQVVKATGGTLRG